MNRPRFRQIAWAFALVGLLHAPGKARADLFLTLEATVSGPMSGLYSYQYLLSVTPQSTASASTLVVGVSPLASIINLLGPTGWDSTFIEPDGLLFFQSPDALLDIAPGQSGTFSFQSPLAPMISDYTVFGFDSSNGFFERSGTVLGPSVPEPGSLTLAAIGGVFLVGVLRRSGRRKGALALLLAAGVSAATFPNEANASDHGDTRENVARLGSDMTDVFIFPSPENPANVVLITTVRPLITPEQVGSVFFDPGLLIQFKIDNTGDSVEDQVIQVRFEGYGAGQKVLVAGPSRPILVGTQSIFGRRQPIVGTFNQTFQPNPALGMKVFCGVREDPFFFDVERLIQIFPDRGIALFGQPDLPNAMFPFGPNVPQFASWRPPGEARDFLENLNLLGVVVELPRVALGGGVIRMWCTVSVPSGPPAFRFVQQERLARPVVNEALATVSNNRHSVNNKINPTQDILELDNDIESFLVFPAGRSPAIRQVIRSVLVPDVMIADLSSTDPASYLGFETGGATGGRFGGRALLDDVADISLAVIFGTVISDLGLAPPDGNQIPALTTDNVGPDSKNFMNVFPYLGNPD